MPRKPERRCSHRPHINLTGEQENRSIGDWRGGVPTGCMLTAWTSSFQLRGCPGPHIMYCSLKILYEKDSQYCFFYYFCRKIDGIRNLYSEKQLTMSKREEDDETLMSRRSFFRKAARSILPMVAMVTIGPGLLSSCGGGGSDEPEGGCVGCSKNCMNECKGIVYKVDSSCKSNCYHFCFSNCKGSCIDSAKSSSSSGSGSSGCSGCGKSCSAQCTQSCVTGCKDSCKDKCKSGCKGSCNTSCLTQCTKGCKKSCKGHVR